MFNWYCRYSNKPACLESGNLLPPQQKMKGPAGKGFGKDLHMKTIG